MRKILALVIVSTALAADKPAPKVTITAPASPVCTNQPTLAITVTFQAQGNVQDVDLLRGTTLLETFTNKANVKSGTHVFTAQLASLAEGTYGFQARAYQGNRNANVAGLSNVLSVMIDRTAPRITSLLPATGSCTKDPRPAFSGTFSDVGCGVDTARTRITLDDADVVAQATAQGFTFTPAANLLDGEHTLAVFLFDKAGNSASASTRITVDTVPPQIAGLQPPDGAFLKEPRPLIAATYSDVGCGIDVASIHLRLDGTEVTGQAAVSAAGISFTPSSPLSEGAHTAVLSVADLATNPASASASWTLDLTRPSVSVVSPADGETVMSATPTLAVAYSDGLSGVDLASLVVMLDGMDVTPKFTKGPDGATWALGQMDALSNAAHTLNARILDRAGNEGSVQSAFSVQTMIPDTTPPAVSLVFPLPQFGQYVEAYTGTSWRMVADARDPGPSASGIAKVEFFFDGQKVAEATSFPYEGSVSFPEGVSGQVKILTAVARDVAGNQATSAPVQVHFSPRPTSGAIAFRASGGPASIQAGQFFTSSVTVQAVDAQGIVDPAYVGTIFFFTSDPQSALNFGNFIDFRSQDHGVRLVNINQMAFGQPPLLTAGPQVIAMADIDDPARDQGVISVNVLAGSPASIAFSPASINQTFTDGATPAPVDAIVKDAFGNLVPGVDVTLEVYEEGALTSTLHESTGPTAVFALPGITSGVTRYEIRAFVTANPARTTSSKHLLGVSVEVNGVPRFVVAGESFVFTVDVKDRNGLSLTGTTVTYQAAFDSGPLRIQIPAQIPVGGPLSVTAQLQTTQYLGVSSPLAITVPDGSISLTFPVAVLAAQPVAPLLGNEQILDAFRNGVAYFPVEIDVLLDGSLIDTITSLTTNQFGLVDFPFISGPLQAYHLGFGNHTGPVQLTLRIRVPGRTPGTTIEVVTQNTIGSGGFNPSTIGPLTIIRDNGETQTVDLPDTEVYYNGFSATAGISPDNELAGVSAQFKSLPVVTGLTQPVNATFANGVIQITGNGIPTRVRISSAKAIVTAMPPNVSAGYISLISNSNSTFVAQMVRKKLLFVPGHQEFLFNPNPLNLRATLLRKPDVTDGVVLEALADPAEAGSSFVATLNSLGRNNAPIPDTKQVDNHLSVRLYRIGDTLYRSELIRPVDPFFEEIPVPINYTHLTSTTDLMVGAENGGQIQASALGLAARTFLFGAEPPDVELTLATSDLQELGESGARPMDFSVFRDTTPRISIPISKMGFGSAQVTSEGQTAQITYKDFDSPGQPAIARASISASVDGRALVLKAERNGMGQPTGRLEAAFGEGMLNPVPLNIGALDLTVSGTLESMVPYSGYPESLFPQGVFYPQVASRVTRALDYNEGDLLAWPFVSSRVITFQSSPDSPLRKIIKNRLLMNFARGALDRNISETLRVERLAPVGYLAEYGGLQVDLNQSDPQLLTERASTLSSRYSSLDGASPEFLAKQSEVATEKMPPNLLEDFLVTAPSGMEVIRHFHSGDEFYAEHFVMDTFAGHGLVERVLGRSEHGTSTLGVIDSGFGDGKGTPIPGLPGSRRLTPFGYFGVKTYSLQHRTENETADVPNDPNVFGHGTPIAVAAAGDGSDIGPLQGRLGTGRDLTILSMQAIKGKDCGFYNIVGCLKQYVKEAAHNPNLFGVVISTNSDPDKPDGNSGLLKEAIEDATKAQIIVIVSAGNDKVDINAKNIFPGNLAPDNRLQRTTNDLLLVAVSGTTCPDGPTAHEGEFAKAETGAGTNFGNSISVAAPALQLNLPNSDGRLSGQDGTSLSAPLVAGILGEMHLLNRALDLNLTAVSMIQLLEGTADDIGLGATKQGHGRVNAWKALLATVNRGLPETVQNPQWFGLDVRTDVPGAEIWINKVKLDDSSNSTMLAGGIPLGAVTAYKSVQLREVSPQSTSAHRAVVSGLPPPIFRAQCSIKLNQLIPFTDRLNQLKVFRPGQGPDQAPLYTLDLNLAAMKAGAQPGSNGRVVKFSNYVFLIDAR